MHPWSYNFKRAPDALASAGLMLTVSPETQIHNKQYQIPDILLTRKVVAVKPKALHHVQRSELLGDVSCKFLVPKKGQGSVLTYGPHSTCSIFVDLASPNGTLRLFKQADPS